MLISERHGFIFVHIPKTAGISIMRALEPYAAHAPRTRIRRLLSKLPIRQSADRISPPIHASAEWARRRLGADLYGSLLSFAIVRNPYDRAISHYEYIRTNRRHHRHRDFRTVTFDQFLQRLAHARARRQSRQVDFVSGPDGRIIVTRLLRFERLAEEFPALCAELGLPDIPPLPHENSSARRAVGDYFRSEEQRRLVQHVYRDDFRLLGYDP